MDRNFITNLKIKAEREKRKEHLKKELNAKQEIANKIKMAALTNKETYIKINYKHNRIYSNIAYNLESLSDSRISPRLDIKTLQVLGSKGEEYVLKLNKKYYILSGKDSALRTSYIVKIKPITERELIDMLKWGK